jgi:hypothetical protein
VPVYDHDPNNVIGLILTKELLFADLADEVPIRTFMSLFPRSVAGVRESDTLSEVNMPSSDKCWRCRYGNGAALWVCAVATENVPRDADALSSRI